MMEKVVIVLIVICGIIAITFKFAYVFYSDKETQKDATGEKTSWRDGVFIIVSILVCLFIIIKGLLF